MQDIYMSKWKQFQEGVVQEIQVQDVKDTINAGSKKFRKAIAKILANLDLEDESYIKEIYDEIFDNPTSADDLEDFIKALIDNATPEDLDENQQGAAANWIKRFILNPTASVGKSPHILSRYLVMGSRGGLGYQLRDISSSVERFFKVQNFIQPPHSKDINSYSDLDSMNDATVEAAELYKKHQQKKQYLDAEVGSKVILDTPEWIVYEPTNKGAACELGKDTEWCTAAPGLTYYEDYYSKDDPLFIFINKANPREKYQFHYGSSQFMDRHDIEIPEEKFLELHGLLMQNVPDTLPSSARDMVVENSDGTRSQKHKFHSKVVWLMMNPPAELIIRTPDQDEWIEHRTGGPAKILFDHRNKYISELEWWYKGEMIGRLSHSEKYDWMGGDEKYMIYFFVTTKMDPRYPHRAPEEVRWGDKVPVNELFYLKDYQELPAKYPQIKEFWDHMDRLIEAKGKKPVNERRIILKFGGKK